MTPQLLSFSAHLSSGTFDAKDGVFRGVSIITEGPAKGHGMLVDATTIDQVKTCAAKFKNGVKVKADHWSGISQILGRITGLKVDAEADRIKLRGDLDLFNKLRDREYYIELLTTLPDSVGLSISFYGTREEIDGFDFARCEELRSIDLVDEPAANSGLFARGGFDTPPRPAMKLNLSAALTPEVLDKQIEGASMTDAFAALKKSTVDFACECKTAREKLEGEKAELSTRASTAEGKVTALEAEKKDLQTKLTEAEDKAKKLEAEKQSVGQRAAELAAANGIPPVTKATEHTNANAGGDAALWTQYQSLTGAAKAAFLATHSAKLEAAATAFDRAQTK